MDGKYAKKTPTNRMKLSKKMGVLFTGVGLLTAVIVFQMYRFSISGFAADPAGMATANPRAAVPAPPDPPIPEWLKWAFGAMVIVFILIVVGTAIQIGIQGSKKIQ